MVIIAGRSAAGIELRSDDFGVLTSDDWRPVRVASQYARMRVRVLSARDLDEAVSARDAIEAMRSAFGQLSAGEARVPLRGHLESALGTTLLMPAYLPGSHALGAKVVSVFPRNVERDLPPVIGTVLLLDADSGAPCALLDGTRLTAVRTAGGSALATELLASPGADVLTVFGAGAQARAHIEVLSAVRPLREVRIVSRTGRSGERLAAALRESGTNGMVFRAFDDRDEALRGAGIVVTATTSTEPVFDGRRLEPGAHVNAVGSYRPDMQEVDAETVVPARVVVDQREAVWAEAGDLIIPRDRGLIDESHVDAELGEIVNGDAPPGREGREVTLFKSVGNAAQDIALASAALEAAEARDLGTLVEL